MNPAIEVNPRLLPYVSTAPGARFAVAALATSVGGRTILYAAPVATLGQANTPWRRVCEATDGVTDIEIYYHPTHSRNLDRYVASVKASLDYYGRNFNPY